MNHESAKLASHLWTCRGLGWFSAKDISKSFGWSLRKVRAVASAAEGKVVSCPGGKGYKHKSACTPAEISEAVSRIRSQIKQMDRKARQIAGAYFDSLTLNRKEP